MARVWWLHHTALLAAAAFSLQACNQSGNQNGSPATEKPPGDKKPTQAEVLELAKSYSFPNPTPPVAPIANLPNPDMPEADAPTKITIARAVPITSPGPSGRVLMALVYSNKSVKRLGIEEGNNYIFRDSTSRDPKTFETYMVPADPGSSGDAKRLKRASEKFSDGDHTEPRLVKSAAKVMTRSMLAFGACLEDPGCTSGHCGYGDLVGP
ncbi:MAG: hypothetical protein HOQ19_03520 [Gemmatimonadaceae bacterium]|nr:hypothetical protein [Gemmatimonadaceae bacterium]NUO93842.1 hypothetical protein [Gemmatimonadaceae bacterium]NUP54876.1 hypothetical protein [Gemmatimonadaceae bacterium]NUS46597.1 hypothetical protein [Gemmatimonadaceae bacterium]